MRRMSTPQGARITRIDGFEIACTLPEPIGNAMRFFDRRVTLLVRLTDADGQVGWGETWSMPGAAATVIRHGLAQAVLAQADGAPRVLWNAMGNTLTYDRRGVTTMAMSAIDIAAWDLAGRRAGMPIARLLGGALRTDVPAYVSGPFLKPGADAYRDFDRDIDGYLQDGFKAMKLRLGLDARAEAALLARLRQRVGDAFPLMVDLNEGATVRSALVFAQRFAESDLVWLEEPIRHDNLPGYAHLAKALPMALAGGEALIGVTPFRDFLAQGALDIVQPDLALCGGFTEGMKIAALADAHGVPVVPHVWGTAINFFASLQFIAGLPELRGPGLRYPLFEFDPSHNPFRDLCGTVGVRADGRIAIPQGPGLGIELDPRQFQEYVVDQWSITR
jgi:D-galactarolactone cycloisomerase